MERIVADGQHENEELEFGAEEQLELLRSNTLAMAYGTIAFVQHQGIPLTAWVDWLGEIFARGWDTDESWTPEDFLDATILNLAAFGGEAIQAEFGDDEATALIAYFPDPDRIAELGLEEVDGDILYELITPIARACGVRYRWQRDGDNVRIRIRPGAVSQ
jgi:hypothetical protein